MKARALGGLLLTTACAASSPARPAPVRAAPVAGASVVRPRSFDAPVLSVVATTLRGPAPAHVREARFELLPADGGVLPIEPVVDGEPGPEPVALHRQATFIVDHDRAPLPGMCAGAPRPAANELVQQAADRISSPSMAIAFVTASVAAERRGGDCTEHAVLAAALLRCRGWPARLAMGLLVIRHEDVWLTGGHMWAEYFDRGWHVADATRPERHGEVAYLRYGTLEDEGPGGLVQVAALLQRWSVVGLQISHR